MLREERRGGGSPFPPQSDAGQSCFDARPPLGTDCPVRSREFRMSRLSNSRVSGCTQLFI